MHFNVEMIILLNPKAALELWMGLPVTKEEPEVQEQSRQYRLHQLSLNVLSSLCVPETGDWRMQSAHSSGP